MLHLVGSYQYRVTMHWTTKIKKTKIPCRESTVRTRINSEPSKFWARCYNRYCRLVRGPHV